MLLLYGKGDRALKKVVTYSKGFSAFSVILSFIALALIGVSLIPLLNVQLNPSRALPSISVSYAWPGASARIIEQEVTSKLEGTLNSIEDIKKISSVSYKGRGKIELKLKKHTNLDIARFEVATLIRRVYPNLPDEVSFPALSPGAAGNKQQTLLTYTLSASGPPFLIQKYAEENIVPKLSALEGVNDVSVYGSTPFEWRITLNTGLTGQLGITVQQVASAINNYFRQGVVGMGDAGKGNNNREIRVLLRNDRTDNELWEHLPVARVKDRIVYLTNIAKIKYQEQLPHSYYRINGLNTINMVVNAQPGSNDIRIANRVKENVKQLKPGLPPGYALTLSYNATEYIEKELSKIGIRGLFSALILLLFILIITRQPRYLAVIALSLVLNLIISVIFYYLFELEVHLYSLAGITVSFGIIIDNSIVMIDHFAHRKNRKIFLPILAATLTTIGALSIVFFLKEEQRVNLIDFVGVMFINLLVSLFIALFFIPAFLEKRPLRTKKNKLFFRRKRKIVRFNLVYGRHIRFYQRFKWAFLVLSVLGFGIPVNWLPKKIEKEGKWPDLYNKTYGGEWATSNLRPILEKVLGGSLRLFSEHVYESSFYSGPGRTKLYIHGSMPEVCTVQQLNGAIEKMENYLSQFDEIEMFETSINSYRNSSITIRFKPEYESGNFPFMLKNMVTSKAISLGGLEWGIYGVGEGFNNSLYSGYKSYQIILEGYNYDKLYAYARLLSDSLLKNHRIGETEIAGEISWEGGALHEYFLHFDPEVLAQQSLYLNQVFSYLNEYAYSQPLQPVFDGGNITPVILTTDKAAYFNSWWLKNTPVDIDSVQTKVSLLGKVGKQKSGNDIYKFNQQYRLIVAWDFIGPPKLADKVLDKHIKMMAPILPLGYKAHKKNWGSRDKKDKNQYYLIFLVIAVIYFICSILLESFGQPLAIIALVPISFIGVFLTFYLSGFNFDQGGFASFIFLAGIGVNSGLYIVNDFNNYKKTSAGVPKHKLYIKAYNHKIVPVILTVLSTVIGLLPFIWNGRKEVFWFSFAVGVIGGLVFSLIAIFIYFPLFLKLDINPKTHTKP